MIAAAARPSSGAIAVAVAPPRGPAELLETQNLLSAVRLPLAAAFVASVRHPAIAFALLAAAGLSDMADGWLARRRGRAGGAGAVIDPISDKVFAASAIAALVRSGRVPAAAAALLLAREMVEAPLLVRDLLSPRPRRRAPSANRRGKLTTVLQFATLASALTWRRATWLLALGTAAVGVAAGIGYWSRDLEAQPSRR